MEASAIKGGKTQERDIKLSQYNNNKPKCAFVMSCDETSLKFKINLISNLILYKLNIHCHLSLFSHLLQKQGMITFLESVLRFTLTHSTSMTLFITTLMIK